MQLYKKKQKNKHFYYKNTIENDIFFTTMIPILIFYNILMTYTLPELPYAMDALAPTISQETLEYHYGKHHQTYVDKLNGMVSGTEFEGKDLEEVIKTSSGWIFNNAAQIWNHTFYWNSLSPNGGGQPTGLLANKIVEAFGSFEDFQEQFSAKAVGNFGSGWTWLIQNDAGALEIINTDDAESALTQPVTPLLVLDVWEHAYYIDYRNARPKYIEAFWNLVNWEFAEGNLR